MGLLSQKRPSDRRPHRSAHREQPRHQHERLRQPPPQNQPRAMTVSGSPDGAIVLRSGADSEMVSGFGRDEARVIADAPGVAHDAQGPLASAELFVIINLP